MQRVGSAARVGGQHVSGTASRLGWAAGGGGMGAQALAFFNAIASLVAVPLTINEPT
jgi:hypothetical protein